MIHSPVLVPGPPVGNPGISSALLQPITTKKNHSFLPYKYHNNNNNNRDLSFKWKKLEKKGQIQERETIYSEPLSNFTNNWHRHTRVEQLLHSSVQVKCQELAECLRFVAGQTSWNLQGETESKQSETSGVKRWCEHRKSPVRDNFKCSTPPLWSGSHQEYRMLPPRA